MLQGPPSSPCAAFSQVAPTLGSIFPRSQFNPTFNQLRRGTFKILLFKFLPGISSFELGPDLHIQMAQGSGAVLLLCMCAWKGI